MTEIKRCPNGHYYDASIDPKCPYCVNPPVLKKGAVLNGRYVIREYLNQGGFTLTYLARDSRLEIDVAVKECFPAGIASRAPDGVSVAVSPENRESFEQYRKLLFNGACTLFRCRRLAHIPVFRDLLQENGTSYLVMDYIQGQTLRQYMNALGRPLTVGEAKKYLLPLLNDLQQLHERGILHRDIAPDNIIITREKESAVLIDFDAMSVYGGVMLDRVIVKHGFAPPEQYKQNEKEGPWTDIYAFAATFYYAITGKVPPEATKRLCEDELIPPRALNVLISDQAQDALLKMLSLKIDERCPAVVQFRDDTSDILDACLSGNPFSFEAESFASTDCLPGIDFDSPSHNIRGDAMCASTVPPPSCMPESSLPSFEAEPFASTDCLPGMDFAPPMPGIPADAECASAAPPPAPSASRPGLGALLSKLFKRDSQAGTTSSSKPDQFGHTTEITAQKPPVSESLHISDVEFSALFPKRFVKGEYSILEIYLYEEAQRQILEEAIRAAEGAVKEKRGSPLRVQSESTIRIRLECADCAVQIEGNDDSQIWRGKYLKFDFAVFLEENYPKRQLMFTATVLIDNVPATRLRFTAECNTLREQKMELLREDILSAFVSYASQDRGRVAAVIQGMKKARPEMDVFFDVDSLRSGENWQQALRAEIERRDILFLCWSLAAKQSEWVDREWRYALDNKGLDGIEPIPIDPPNICPPPKELASKHFNDRSLLYMNK